METIKFIITEMFKAACNNTKYSPDKHFMLDLEEWCANAGKDFNIWQESMYRLFSLRSAFPHAHPTHIVGYVIERDKEKLFI